MQITAAGNVGIGVTPETWTSDYTALQIGGGSSLFGHTTGGGDASNFLGQNVYHNSGWKYINANEASNLQQKNGNFYFHTAPSGSADATISFSEKFRIQHSGGAYFQNTSLGIGSAPSYPLDVNTGGEIGLRVLGSGAGYVQGSILIAGGTDNTPANRGQGIFLHNGGHDVTWYMGSPYLDGDRFVINRKASTSSPSNQAAYIHATAATNFLTIESDGVLSTAGDIYPGADVIMASGRGISFTATGDGPTMSSELLDDYEEGSWTVTDQSGAGMSLTVYVAEYTKIGNKVFFEIGMVFPTTSSTADVRLSIPFTAKSTSDNTGGAVITTTNSGRNDSVVVVRNTATMSFATNLNVSADNDDYSGKQFRCAGQYTAA
jgi:hypothetical protein